MLINERKQAKSNMRYGDAASINTDVKKLKRRQERKSMSLVEEKCLIKEIRQHVMHIWVQKAQTSKRRKKIDDTIHDNEDDPDADLVSATEALKELCETLIAQCDLVLDKVEDFMPGAQTYWLNMEDVLQNDNLDDVDEDFDEGNEEIMVTAEDIVEVPKVHSSSMDGPKSLGGVYVVETMKLFQKNKNIHKVSPQTVT